MKIKPRLMKPFVYSTEEAVDYGLCFIIFHKRPVTMESVEVKPGYFEQKVIEWKCVLYINLWIVDFRIVWDRKLRKKAV